MSRNNPKKSIVASFLAIPFAASVISMVHIVSFFKIGNIDWMAMTLAITFEIAALASLVSFTVLNELKGGKVTIYFVFIILFFMQMIGNVYYSFDYVTQKLLVEESWINTFKEFLDTTVSLFTDEMPSASYTKFILACTIGMPIPLISLSFIHILVKYLEREDSKEEETKVVKEVEEITEDETIKKILPEDNATDHGTGSGVVVEH